MSAVGLDTPSVFFAKLDGAMTNAVQTIKQRLINYVPEVTPKQTGALTQSLINSIRSSVGSMNFVINLSSDRDYAQEVEDRTKYFTKLSLYANHVTKQEIEYNLRAIGLEVTVTML